MLYVIVKNFTCQFQVGSRFYWALNQLLKKPPSQRRQNKAATSSTSEADLTISTTTVSKTIQSNKDAGEVLQDGPPKKKFKVSKLIEI